MSGWDDGPVREDNEGPGLQGRLEDGQTDGQGCDDAENQDRRRLCRQGQLGDFPGGRRKVRTTRPNLCYGLSKVSKINCLVHEKKKKRVSINEVVLDMLRLPPWGFKRLDIEMQKIFIWNI